MSLFRWDRTHAKFSSSATSTCGAGRRSIFLLSEVSNPAPMNSKVVGNGQFASGLELNSTASSSLMNLSSTISMIVRAAGLTAIYNRSP